MPADWRVARSLEVLLGQLNVLAPRRSKASDGSIGDAAHATRDSDHNPWYGPGIVTARDFTHDPGGGLDCHALASILVAQRDPRVKYIIWNNRILSGNPGPSPWVWRAYSGSNPHTKHLHLSVVASPACDSTAAWAGLTPTAPPAPEEELPMIIQMWDQQQGRFVPTDAAPVIGNTHNYALEAAANSRAILAAVTADGDLTEDRLRTIYREELDKRPVVADVNEAALAAELDARGYGGVSASELKEILASVRLVPAQEGNPA